MRTINAISSKLATTVLDPLPSDLKAWLAGQAAAHEKLGLRWLLAHCYDGVIWGELRAGALALSCEAFPERGLGLRWPTLQQARLFGEHGELLLWPGSKGAWNMTLRHDQPGEGTSYIDEEQMLWGTRDSGTPVKGFLRIVEGVQGITHAPPIATTPITKALGEKPYRTARARLLARHYLGEDTTTGMFHVAAGRLVRLCEPEETSPLRQQ